MAPTSIHLRVFVALGLLGVAASCGGGDARPPEPPGIVRAVAVRQIEEGFALRETVIEIEFADAVYNGKRDAPTPGYFSVEVPSATALDGTDTIGATSVTVEGAMVLVTVGRPVAMDAVLSIDAGFFGRDDLPLIEVDVASTLSTLEATFAGTALRPTFPEVVTAGEAPAVIAEDRDAEFMRLLMVEHLIIRGSNETTVGRAVGNYDAIPVDVVPSPKLRAAIAGLTGSFAEPAIAYLFSDSNCTESPVAKVAFEEIPGGLSLLARVVFDDHGDRVVLLDPTLEGEPFELLMPLIAHEAIHCDRIDTAEEEIAASAFDVLLYAQLLTIDPSLALLGTPLARALNLDLIAMINSGRRYPESLGVLASDGVVQVLPGSNSTNRSFADQIANAYDLDSSDNARPEILADVYTSILAESVGFEAGQPFDLVYLDQLISLQFTELDLAAVAIALTLEP